MGAGLADTAVTGQRLVGGGVEMRRLLSADAFSVSTAHAGATVVPKARWCCRGTPISPRAGSICSSVLAGNWWLEFLGSRYGRCILPNPREGRVYCAATRAARSLSGTLCTYIPHSPITSSL